MQEQAHQIKIYGFFQKMVYALVVLEFLAVVYMDREVPVLSGVLKSLSGVGIFFPPVNGKFFTLLLIALVAFGTRAKKESNIKIGKAVVLPIFMGLFLMFLSLVFLAFLPQRVGTEILPHVYPRELFYLLSSLLGALLAQSGADSISKIVQGKLGKDRFNLIEESFDQNELLKSTSTSINLPYEFRLRGRFKKGWINLDPFRGTIVIGTPGSGKSFGVIAPAIRQMSQKGFCLCLYDFKSPDLTQIAYYWHQKQKKEDPSYKHQFQVVNLNEVEKSCRVNPLRPEYVQNLAMAQEMAESMVFSLQRGGSAGGGADQFFTQSAVNFLSSCIYFFAVFNKGKYSSLPHVLAFLNRSYQEIFDTLFTNKELHSLLSPFKSAYDNRAFDQLEGQVGTLRIFMSRLATKESFWVFSSDSVQLKITDPLHPTTLVLSSSPETQDINSALYAALLNRVLRQINEKGNLPAGVLADEFPTIYIHRIDTLIATARSHKVAVLLGLQELPQLRQLYKKEIADTICAVVGNILSGSVRDKHTLDWLERLFGKIKQTQYSESYSRQGSSHSRSERLEALIPAGKIASLSTGEMVGLVARGNRERTGEYESSAFSGQVIVEAGPEDLEAEEQMTLPFYPPFDKPFTPEEKEKLLFDNFQKVHLEVEEMLREVHSSN